MTTTTLSFSPDRRRSPRTATASTSPAPVQAARREYRERDFGVGYGRSSGYASDRRYASEWTGALRFRCG